VSAPARICDRYEEHLEDVLVNVVYALACSSFFSHNAGSTPASRPVRVA